jgi:Nitrile hydratase, alpha chain
MSVNENAFGKIIAKAWRDPAFKAELIANPAAVLKAEGVDVPAGMTVTVVENTDRQFHLVLPPVPSDELSDEALDAVAGGNIAPKNRGHCKPG